MVTKKEVVPKIKQGLKGRGEGGQGGPDRGPGKGGGTVEIPQTPLRA